MKKFITDLLLFLVAYILTPIVELLTFIVVAFKFKLKALNYFDDLGYNFDLQSAGRHRTLWNTLLIKKTGYKFYKHKEDLEKRTISRIIGINDWLGELTFFGKVILYILWAIDYPHWFNGGHCFQSMKANDFEIKINRKYERNKNLQETIK